MQFSDDDHDGDDGDDSNNNKSNNPSLSTPISHYVCNIWNDAK
jgi:hypothetical protein